jgi:hypothetical protein
MRMVQLMPGHNTVSHLKTNIITSVEFKPQGIYGASDKLCIDPAGDAQQKLRCDMQNLN